MTELFSLYGKQGWFLFKDVEVKPEDLDLPDEVPEMKGDKTPAQRMRSVLYVLWEKNTSQKETFNTYYAQQMERLIEHIKSKLNE